MIFLDFHLISLETPATFQRPLKAAETPILATSAALLRIQLGLVARSARGALLTIATAHGCERDLLGAEKQLARQIQGTGSTTTARGISSI